MEIFYTVKEGLVNPLIVKHLNLSYSPVNLSDLSKIKEFLNLEILEVNLFKENLTADIIDLPHLHTIIFSHIGDVFPEVILKMPQIRHLHFKYQFAKARNLAFLNAFAEMPQLESLIFDTNFEQNSFPNAIFGLKNLKKLAFSVEDVQKLPTYALLENQNLEILELKCFHFTPKILKNISQLPNLHTLKINQIINYSKKEQEVVSSLPDFIANLSQLKCLHLSLNNLKTLPVSLNQLTHLQRLSFENCELENFPFEKESLKNLRILNLGRQKKLPINEILGRLNPACIWDLDLSNCALKKIPDNLLTLTDLTNLSLMANQIQTLPYEWTKLTELSFLDLRFNPIAKKTEMHSGSNWVKINQLCESQSLSQARRQLYLALLLKDEEFLAKAPIEFLWEATNFPFLLIRLHAYSSLQNRLISPFEADFKKEKPVLAFIGKIKGRKINVLSSQLKNLGIKVLAKLSQEVNYVVVGEEAGEKLKQAMALGLHLVLPHHLIQFLENEEKPYLLESSPEIRQNLGSLLRSEDIANLQIATQIMLEGGVPDELFYQVILLYFSKQDKAKQTLKKLIDKILSPTWLEIIRKYGRKMLPTPIKLLMKETIVDKKALLKAALEVFEQGSYRDWLYGQIMKLCFETDTEIVKMALQRHISGSELNLEKLYLSKLPVELKEFAELTHLNLHYNRLRRIPKILTQLSQLKYLDISNNGFFAEWEKAEWQNTLPQVEIIWERKS